MDCKARHTTNPEVSVTREPSKLGEKNSHRRLRLLMIKLNYLELAAFLASDHSDYITDTEIVIDGGNVIQEH